MADILAAPQWLSLDLSSGADVNRDFSRYDAYLNDLGVLLVTEQNRRTTRTLELRPEKQDTGQSEFEARPEYGDWFAQGDFSHGKGQRHFHRATRDDSKYYHSEGFDISDPGVLEHLYATAEADNTNLTDPKALEEFNDLPFVAQGNDVYRGNNNWPGTWTAEDPEAGESAVPVLSLATGGDRLYAALGAGGIHLRDTSAVWDHLHTSTPTDVNTGDTRVVRWLKDRLMVVGNAGRSIYEVIVTDGIASVATPTAIETIPSGWEFTEIFEAGPFIFACAVNATAGRSRVHAYGLNSGASAIEKKSSTPMPKGVLVYAGCGTEGRIFLGGGRKTKDNGKNPIFLEAQANETGELQTLLIAEETELHSSDFSVRAFEVLADSVIFGWGRDDTSIYGRFTGLARFQLARNAFSLYLSMSAASDRRIHDVMSYRDRVLLAVESEGLFYEDIGTPVTTAFLITSEADWNNAGTKTWDLFEVRHGPLTQGTSIKLQYTKRDVSANEWQDAVTSEIAGAVGAESRVEGIISRPLSLKIISTASGSASPKFLTYSVRSVPSPSMTEWRLTRTVRLLERDRKDRRAEQVTQKPREVRLQIQDMAHTFVSVYEPGVTWIAYVEDVQEVEPASAMVSETAGTGEREAYFLELSMVARRAA